jgi:acyl-CoA thioester hydrolase
MPPIMLSSDFNSNRVAIEPVRPQKTFLLYKAYLNIVNLIPFTGSSPTPASMEPRMNAERLFVTPIDVRFRDLDAMEHVNNAVVFTYFEEGRKHFFFQNMQARSLSGFNFILARIACDYLRPIKLNDKLQLQMWVADVGTKSFKFGYRLVDGEDASVVFAEGESVQVCYDYQQNCSTPIPPDLKSVLEIYRKN